MNAIAALVLLVAASPDDLYAKMRAEDGEGVKHQSCASGNCGSGGMARRPRRQEWPSAPTPQPVAAKPEKQPPLVAVPAKPVKECNCEKQKACECDPLAIIGLDARFDAIEAAIAKLAAAGPAKPQPINVDELADAIQKRLTLPARVVDANGKQIGGVVKVPLNNQTPLTLRLRKL